MEWMQMIARVSLILGWRWSKLIVADFFSFLLFTRKVSGLGRRKENWNVNLKLQFYLLTSSVEYSSTTLFIDLDILGLLQF